MLELENLGIKEIEPKDIENVFMLRYLNNKMTEDDDKFYTRVDWKIKNDELLIEFN